MNSRELSMSDQIAQAAKGITATTAATAPTVGPVYGSYLTTNGIGLLSFSEIIQVLGAVYVSFLLIKALLNTSIGKKISSKISGWFK
tara:strand:- start:30166 stop:30426 length:261 start_codon:yes stop_codon:yes gene_type:complete